MNERGDEIPVPWHRLTEEERRDIEHKLDLVWREAYDIAERYEYVVQPADFLGPGTLGLLDADRRFSPERGRSYDRYVRLRIRGAMFDFLAEELLPARKRLELAMDRAANRQAILDAENVDPDAALDDRQERKADALGQATLAVAVGMAVALEHPSPEQEATTREGAILAREALRQALAALTPEERDLLMLYHEQRKTQTQIATLYGVSEKTVRRRVAAAATRLRAMLETAGVTGPVELDILMPASGARGRSRRWSEEDAPPSSQGVESNA